MKVYFTLQCNTYMASMDGLCFALLREYVFNIISVMYMASTNELSFTREYDIILCRICDRSIIQSKTQSISWLMPITAAYSFIQTMKGIPGIKDPFQYKDQLFGYIDAFRKNIYLLDGIYIYIYIYIYVTHLLIIINYQPFIFSE